MKRTYRLSQIALIAVLMGCQPNLASQTLIGAKTPSSSPTAPPPLAPEPVASLDPSLIPAPVPTSSASSVYPGTLRGEISLADGTASRLGDGVRLVLKSLDPQHPYEREVRSANGQYRFESLPYLETDTQFQLEMSYLGYQTVQAQFPLKQHAAEEAVCLSVDALKVQHAGDNSSTAYGEAVLHFSLQKLETPLSFSTPAEIILRSEDIPYRSYDTTLPCYASGGGPASIIGNVRSDLGASIDGATVIATSLNQSRPYQAIASTVAGNYTLSDVPTGITLYISVSKNGMGTRHQKIVPMSSISGDLDNVMRLDFAGDHALSDRPDVIAVTPTYGATGIDVRPEIAVEFSEPVEKTSVEDSLQVIAVSESSNSADYETPTNSIVLAKDNWTASWNNEGTKVTLNLKASLPTDRDISRIPTYAISFNPEKPFKDLNGMTSRAISRLGNLLLREEESAVGSGAFYLDGTFKNWSPFYILPDQTPPQVASIKGFASLRQVRVTFNEPMQIVTQSGTIVGTGDESPVNPAHYSIKVNGLNPVPWTSFTNASASFLGGDNRTIVLHSDYAFQAGSTLEVTVSESLIDPAGNVILGSARTASAEAQ